MTGSRPYLVRALWEWIVDNGMTPHVLVDATQEGVQVPREFVQDGRITLNLSHSAVQGLVLGNDGIVFSARFSGRAMAITLPLASVLAIFARENGQGMMFGSEPGRPSPTGDPHESPAARPQPSAGKSPGGDSGPEDPGPPSGGSRRGPGLRVVK